MQSKREPGRAKNKAQDTSKVEEKNGKSIGYAHGENNYELAQIVRQGRNFSGSFRVLPRLIGASSFVFNRLFSRTRWCETSAAAHDVFPDAEACALKTLELMYCRAQICIYYLLWTATLSLKLTLEQETTTAKNWDCPAECICLSPKQALCNTGGLKDIPTLQLPQTVEELSLTKNNFPIIKGDAFAGLKVLKKLTMDAHASTLHREVLKHTLLLNHKARCFRWPTACWFVEADLHGPESDLGIIERAAFAGLSHVDRLNILNNKIDLIEKLFLRYENNIEMLRFHGNHVLQAPRHAKDIKLEVNSISAIDNHFPCDCQAHNVLESDFVNGTISDFQKRNFCISPIEYNGKPMNLVDFDLVARCYDNVVQDNLGSGVIGVFTLPTTLFLILLFSLNLFQ
ncbi:Leucine-rich repeat LGI family member 2 [Anthophora quadrimaculata]